MQTGPLSSVNNKGMSNLRTKIENAEYILTLDPQRRIIRNGSLVIAGDRITDIGPARSLADIPVDRVIDARGMVVTPGFINAHDHLYPQITRGMFLDEITPSYVEDSCVVRNGMNEEEEYFGTLSCLTEHLKTGTTTVLNPGDSQRVEGAVQAYEMTGIRAIMGSNVSDTQNQTFAPVMSTTDALARLESLLKTYHGRAQGRINAWVMLAYATVDCSPELASAAKRLADEYATGMTFHQSARQSHVEMCLRDRGMRPIQFLEKMGVVGPNVLLGHGVQLDELEVDILARTNTRVAMCPGTSLRLGYGTTVVGKMPEMLAKGVTVALGTDSSDFGITDILRPTYLAATLYKDSRRDTSMIAAETALELATIKGAQAVGLDRDIGSLEPGKKADIVLFNTRRSEWRPLYNPVNNLVYNADGRSVHTVLVDGIVRVEAGKATFIDEQKLMDDVQSAGERLLARINYTVPSRWPIVH